MERDEEVENKHLSMKKTHSESVLTVKDQSIESLEKHKSSLEEMTDKVEDFVDYKMNQVVEPCEPNTVENSEIVSDMTQGKEVNPI